MGVKISGSKEAIRSLKVFTNTAALRRVVQPAMTMAAEAMMSDAKRRTPVDTGRLRASGRVERARTTGTRVVVVLGFHTKYAGYVHEDLNANHPVGQAKFLALAVKGGKADMERAIANAIEKEMKK